MRWVGGKSPALRTSTSSPPKRRTHARDRGVDGGAVASRRRRGRGRRRRGTPLRRPARRRARRRPRPACGRPRRSARPMPLAPPVTRAMRPASGGGAAPPAELPLLELPVLDLEELRLAERAPAAERLAPLEAAHAVARDVGDLVGAPSPTCRSATRPRPFHTAQRGAGIEGRARAVVVAGEVGAVLGARSARGRRGRRRRPRPGTRFVRITWSGVTGPRVARSATSARRAKPTASAPPSCRATSGAARGARRLAPDLGERERVGDVGRARARGGVPGARRRGARPPRGRRAGSSARSSRARRRRRRRRRGGGAPCRRASGSPTPRVRFQTSRASTKPGIT